MSNPFTNPFESILGAMGRDKAEITHVADMFRNAGSVTEYRLVADALDWASGKSPEGFIALMNMLRDIARAKP